jgi:hypothetical protein
MISPRSGRVITSGVLFTAKETGWLKARDAIAPNQYVTQSALLGAQEIPLSPGDMSIQEAELLAAQWKDRAHAEMIAAMFDHRRTPRVYRAEFSATPTFTVQAAPAKDVRREIRQ